MLPQNLKLSGPCNRTRGSPHHHHSWSKGSAKGVEKRAFLRKGKILTIDTKGGGQKKPNTQNAHDSKKGVYLYVTLGRFCLA